MSRLHLHQSNLGLLWRGTLIRTALALAFVLTAGVSVFANYDHGELFGTSNYAYSASEIDQGTYLKFWWCGAGYVSGWRDRGFLYQRK
jgi:hypothetical protein